MTQQKTVSAALEEALTDIRTEISLKPEQLDSLQVAVGSALATKIGSLVLATDARLHESSPPLGPTHQGVGAVMASHGTDTIILCGVLDQVSSDNSTSQQISGLVQLSMKDQFLFDLGSTLGLVNAVVLGAGQSPTERVPAVTQAVLRLVGACSFFSGFDVAEELLRPHIIANRRPLQGAVVDSKTMLQEYCQSTLGRAPSYDVLSKEGPQHALRFTCRVQISLNESRKRGRLSERRNEGKIDELSATAAGSSKKQAEQGAARVMLEKLDHESVTPESNHPGPVRFAKHVIPAEQLNSLSHVEELLDYHFEDRRLLSMALIHKSFTHETRNSETGEYGLLATLGSYVLPWLGTERMIAQAERWIADGTTIRRSLGFACQADKLATCAGALSLDRFAIFGKGQRKIGPTKRILSDLFQACVGAVVLDNSTQPGSMTKSCPKLLERYFETLDVSSEPLIVVDAKGQFQRIATAIGLEWNYSTESRGPDHRCVFTSQLELRSGRQRCLITGSPRFSKTEAEASAAESAIAIARSLEPDSKTLHKLILEESEREKVCQLLTVKMLTVLRRGWPGLRYLSSEGFLSISDLLARDSDAAAGTLAGLYARLRRLGLEQHLSDIEAVLHLIPSSKQEEATMALGDFVEHLEEWLATWKPSLSPEGILDQDIFPRLIVAASLLARLSVDGPKPQSLQGLVDIIKYLKLRSIMTEITIHGDLSPGAAFKSYPGFLSECVAALLTVADRSVSPPTRVLIQVRESQHRVHVALCSDPTRDWSPIVDRNFLKSLISLGGATLAESDNNLEISVPLTEPESHRSDPWLARALRIWEGGSDTLLETLRIVGQLIHDEKNLLIAIDSRLSNLSKLESRQFSELAVIDELREKAREHALRIGLLLRQQGSMKAEPFEVKFFLSRFVADLLGRVPSNVSVTTSLGAEAALVLGDADLLRMTLENLCKNAIESMPSGGHLQIEQILDEETSAAMVQISDSGGGVRQEVLDQLRAGRPIASDKHTAPGLGLLSASRIVREHGGSFDLRRNDYGTIATVILPVQRSGTISGRVVTVEVNDAEV